MLKDYLQTKSMVGLLGFLALISTQSQANVRVPNNPQTRAECDDFENQLKEVARQKWDKWKELYEQNNQLQHALVSQCGPLAKGGNSKAYWQCSDHYSNLKSKNHARMEVIKADHDAYERTIYPQVQQCRQVAKANTDQRERQEQAHKEAERHQREAAREAEARQRQAQAESERQQRESEYRQRQAQAEADRQRQAQIRQQQDQQNQQYQQQLAMQQRALAQQQIMQQQAVLNVQAQMQAQARQQAALNSLGALGSVASAPKPSPGLADQAIELVTPKGPAHAISNAVETRRFANEVLEKTTEPGKMPSVALDKLLEEAPKKMLEDKNNEVRRDALDRVLNPRRDSNEEIDYAVGQATKMNSTVQKARFGPEGKLIAQIGNDGISGVGAVANATLGEFERTMAAADQALSNNTGSATSYPTRPAPVSTSRLENLGGGSNPPSVVVGQQPTSSSGTADLLALMDNPDAPRKTCLAWSAAELDTCLARQCSMERYASHADCKDFKK